MKDSCKNVNGLLGRYLDGELEPTTAAQVEEHLKACPDCRKELEALRALDLLVREQDSGPELADDYWDWHRHQVWKRVRAGKRERRQRSYYGERFLWLRVAAVTAGAAVILVAVVAGWKLLDVMKARPGQAPMMVADVVEEKTAETVGYGESRSRAGAADRRRTPVEADRDGPDRRTISDGEFAAGTGGATAQEEVLSMSDRTELDATGELVAAGLRGAEDGKAAEHPSMPAAVVAKKTARKAGAAGVKRLLAGDTEPASALPPAGRDDDVGLPVAGLKGEMRETTAVLALGQCDESPELIEVPVLPTVLSEDTATVFVMALVEADGLVSKAEVERSSGIGLLDSIAVENVRQARFQPGVQAGRNVSCWVRVEQKFRLEPEPADEVDSTDKAAEQ